MEYTHNDKIIQINNEKQSLKINSTKHEGFWELYAKNEWEPETFKIFDRFIHPNSVYIDIGAWVGPTVLYAAQKARLSVAVEPDKDAYRELEQNIELNPELKNKIKCKNIAITEKNEIVKIYTREFSANSGSSILETQKTEEYYEVQGITFDELFKEFPLNEVSFIKIDIEGAEYYSVPELKNILEKLEKHPTIYLSLHAPNLIEPLPKKKFKQFFHNLKMERKVKLLTEKLVNSLGFYKYFYDTNGNVINDRKSLSSINDKFISIVITDEKWK